MSGDVVVSIKQSIGKGSCQKKTGKLVTSAKKEGGGSGQNHDLRFLWNSDKSQRGGGVRKELSLFLNCLCVCFRGNSNQD